MNIYRAAQIIGALGLLSAASYLIAPSHSYWPIPAAIAVFSAANLAWGTFLKEDK